MSTYVIGDIHGCYDHLINMLNMINLTDSDCLIFVGDYIGYGAQNYKMLKWLYNLEGIGNTIDITFLKGDHDIQFVSTVKLLKTMCDVKGWKRHSLKSTKEIYELAYEMMKTAKTSFDDTQLLSTLIYNDYLTIEELLHYSLNFEKMMLGIKLFIANKPHVVVHAGYLSATTRMFYGHEDRNHFSTYANKEAFLYGGYKHGVVISGHNPTIRPGFFFNNGEVFRYYNSDNDCIYYDIDCGCGLGNENINAHLACIRLEDKAFFYV